MVKKLHVRKDDTVVVVSGKDKGKQGKVLRALPKEGKVVVEGVNVVARQAERPRRSGRDHSFRGSYLCVQGNAGLRKVQQSNPYFLQDSSGRQEGPRMQEMRG